MHRRLGAVAVSVVMVVAGTGTACGRSTSAAKGAAGTGVVLRGLAASSLTAALGGAATAYRRDIDPNVDVSFSFEGSQQVVAQLDQGVGADLAATAGKADMDTVVAKHLVEAPTVFARNRLEILVAPGNPKHIATLTDLGRADVAVVVAAPEVPAGRYAAQVLQRAGVAVHPKSLELDVKSAVRRVTGGEADAALVYVTDVKAAGNQAMGVELPTAQNVFIPYFIAVTTSSPHRADARRFVASLLAGPGQRALMAQGFEAP